MIFFITKLYYNLIYCIMDTKNKDDYKKFTNHIKQLNIKPEKAKKWKIFSSKILYDWNTNEYYKYNYDKKMLFEKIEHLLDECYKNKDTSVLPSKLEIYFDYPPQNDKQNILNL